MFPHNFKFQGLPIELQLLTIQLIATECPETLAKLLLSCKTILDHVEIPKIIRSVDLTKYIKKVEEFTPKQQGILATYYGFNHPVALFVQGMHNFCFQNLTIAGIQKLEKGFEMGDDLCQYALGLCLLSVDNFQGAVYLRRLFNTKPRTLIKEYRETVRTVSLQDYMLFQYPTRILCWKSGPNHWNYDQIVPLNNEEEAITCLNCAIRLEFSKLINHIL